MKKLAGTFLILVFICYISVYLTFISMPVTDVLNEVMPAGKVYDTNISASFFSEYSSLEEKSYSFISKNFLKKDGGIITNLKAYEGSSDTLSEAVGLLMNYYLLKDNKELFDKEASFLRNRMLVEQSFVKWRYGSQDAYCNAVIDDLRITRALLDAADRWGQEEYYNLAGFMQQGLYEKQVKDRNLYELYDWKSKSCKHSMPLCYLDLYTIDRVSDFNWGWLNVEEKALSVINGGRISAASPFFYKTYDYDTAVYSLDEEYESKGGICLTYTLYTALHLAEVNEDTGFFTDWLKNEAKKGRLYAWYNPHTLKPAGGVESTAVYALAAVYAANSGEAALYRRLVGLMNRFMVSDKSSKFFGGFGDINTKYFHEFDNLCALWAYSIDGE